MAPLLGRATKVVRVPIYQALFLKIAEPHIIRLMVFGVYLCSMGAGILVLMHRPEQFLQVLGSDLAFTFGILLVIAAGLGLISVLPGIWWLERVGIILHVTCVSWYLVILVYLNASPVAGGFVLGFAVFLAIRFIEIRGAQLAPREG